MDQNVLIAIILGVVCVGAVAFVFAAPTQKDKANKRLQTIKTKAPARRVSSGGSGGGNNEASAKERRKKLTESLAALDDKTKKLKKKKRVTMEQRLEQAGLPLTPKHFYFASVGCAFFFAFVGLISGQKLWIIGLLFLIGALGFPRWVIGFLKGRRQKKFVTEFSNAIDVIVRGVKSGLPVNECLKIISKEAPKPVCDEFHMLVEGMRVGLSLEQALTRMHERMPLQEVNFFAIVLLIQQKTGGNLAEALGNLSGVLRSRKLMEGKIKALSSEAKASAWIIGSLPFLVAGAVKLSSPEYLDPLFTTKVGNFVLIGAGIWMSMGIMVMKKMTMIKV